jgi:hypothetical protein
MEAMTAQELAAVEQDVKTGLRKRVGAVASRVVKGTGGKVGPAKTGLKTL